MNCKAVPLQSPVSRSAHWVEWETNHEPQRGSTKGAVGASVQLAPMALYLRNLRLTEREFIVFLEDVAFARKVPSVIHSSRFFAISARFLSSQHLSLRIL